MDIWDLKYHFELAAVASAPGSLIRPAPQGSVWEAVAPDGQVIGSAGPIEVDQPKWAAPVFGFEVRLDAAAATAVRYKSLPVAPPVVLDLALVLPAGVTVGAVAARFREAAGPLLERLEVFDEYRGDKVPAGTRSVAWHCAFRDPARTLSQKEVDRLVTAALKALEDAFDVRRREG